MLAFKISRRDQPTATMARLTRRFRLSDVVSDVLCWVRCHPSVWNPLSLVDMEVSLSYPSTLLDPTARMSLAEVGIVSQSVLIVTI